MFTGLVEEVGTVKGVRPHDGGFLLSVRCQKVLEDMRPGDSISVNGACLTVVEVERDGLSAHVSFETGNRTNLGYVRPGDRLNLERALRPDSRLGGHLVTGHVDAMGKVSELRRRGEYWEICFRCPREVLDYLVPKGSVAVNGVSLTVNEVYEDGFSVVLIPHTLGETNLSGLEVGDAVNLEADILGKYVFRYMERKEAGASPGESEDVRLWEKLERGGFLS
jgi:riboflavin synthase